MMTLKALIVTVAAQHGVDPQIALSVAFVESGFDHSKVSPTNDYGIFQLNLKYFPNAPELTVDENIRVGIKHLAWVKKHCKIDQDRIMEIGPVVQLPDMKHLWVNCYNAGVVGTAKLLKPWDFGYYKRIMEQYGKH
jgi:hypothetical protein